LKSKQCSLGLYSSRADNLTMLGGRSVGLARGSHNDRRHLCRRYDRNAVPAVPMYAEVQRQTVQPDGDQFADDRQRVKPNAKPIVVVQQTGAFAVA